ncbi:dihydrofolate reductase family protein [Sediminicoccus sp. KRV36]|uniref:dihydrofolate reductase family protein n=1 Tax=Sediminicoccus sp. KRV36 TaxID=3133721 RepID=UPI00200BB295|nr:dihydrofolate reductase family protein [Sediminicoccus rosea]UPY36551.1 dihydrofolate reductase family protein [Sediminicoccus rosea]
MPGCVAYIAASLDGFIATADGSVAWLEAFQATDYGYAEFFAGIGTLVMGRATYDQVLAFGAWPYAGKPCLVLSRSGIANPPEGVAAWKGDAASLATHLAQLKERVWVVGGGKLIAGLLAEGAVTELDLFTMPVLLGRGIPLFAGGHPPAQKLSLLDTQTWPNGVVRLRYAIG